MPSAPSAPHHTSEATDTTTLATVFQRPNVPTKKTPYLSRINRLFLLTVILPTTIAAVYYGLIASNVYTSTSSFLIYSPESPQVTGLNALLQNTGLGGSSAGASSVQDYVRSRAALAQLQKSLHIQKVYSSPKIDIFNRFGGFLWRPTSQEELYKYYKNMVDDNIDSSSGISSLSVHAYTPRDAKDINQKLLELSQRLINQLNEQANSTTVDFYQRKVKQAEARALNAESALSRYRNQSGVFTPGPQVALQSQLISKLQDNLLSTQLRLRQMETATPRNPQIAFLKRTTATLRREIFTQESRITGSEDSLASKSVQYERLALSKAFADRELSSALASLQQAEVQAQKQQLFLESISPPSQPDASLTPKRARNTAAVFLLGFITWGILSILIAGVREHHD